MTSTLAATHLHALIAHLPGALFSVDAEWRLVFVNPQAAHLLGQEAERLLGQRWWDVRPDLRGTPLAGAAQDALRAGTATTLTVYDERGSAWWEYHLFPVPPGLGVTLRDVTAQRLAEQERSSLATVVDASTDCIKVLDLDARLLSMNVGGQQTMEIDDFSACRNLLWPTFWQGAAREQVELALDRARRGERTTFEGQTATFRGTLKWWEVTVSPVWDEDGHVRHLLAVSRDITARRAAETGLRESETRFRRMVEASPVAIAVGDRSGRLSLVNDAYSKLLGYTRAEFEAGRIDWAALTPAEYREADERAFSQAFEHGASEPYEKEMLTRTGERLPLHLVLIRYEDGEQTMVVGYLQDLRAQKAAERVLREHSAELERQVAARTRQIEEKARAQEAFVAYTEAASTQTDVLALARRAVDVLRAVLGEVSVTYYDLDGALWKVRVWSDDLAPEVVAVLTAGIPTTAPSYAEAMSSREVVFVPGWEAGREGVAATEGYGAGAFYPCLVGDTPRGLLAMGTRRAGDWTPQERQVFRAVGRSLTLALERAEGARRLETQNAELDARTRALEGFADLTRDLSVEADPYVLVRRAQEVMLSLLPDGYALYFEPVGAWWALRAQTGDLRSAALQAAANVGFPYHQARNLLIPFTTLAPYYQDQYDQDTDNIGELVSHLGATATFPVLMQGRPRGVLAVVLFGELRPWTGTDRAVMETVVRSLGLALERAAGVEELAQRTQELERSNAELEQFAYIASHDLQAPIRAVTSFAGVIDKRYGGQLDDRGRLYLRQIVEGGEHMKRLVDDLLAFSRVHTERRTLLPTDATAVFDVVAGRLQAQTPGVGITRGALPVVLADAQQLDQLLQNLIGNGLKYHREGVTPQVHVRAERDGELWRFTVQDNGIGIEPQYFERIFVIFQRLHGREEYEGTGIGLAVCKKIVERHGGRLWVESTLGEGTTFCFTLPEG